MVFLSISCLGRVPLAAGLSALSALGVDHVELTGGSMLAPDPEGACEDLLKTVDALGLRCLVHNYFPPQPQSFVVNLASRDPSDLGRLRTLLAQGLALTSALGQGVHSVHGPFGVELTPRMGPEGYFIPVDGARLAWEDFEANLAWIASMLPRGVRLAVENAFPSLDDPLYSLLASPEDFQRFAGVAKRLGNVGLLMDLGHLAVAADRLGFDMQTVLDSLLENHPGLILGLHLSHNDGSTDQHLPCLPGTFALDWTVSRKKALAGRQATLEWRGMDLDEAARGWRTVRDLYRNE